MSNLLSEVHPELVLEWSERNLPLTPDKITYGSNKIVWWIGTCGHEFQSTGGMSYDVRLTFVSHLCLKCCFALQWRQKRSETQ